MQYAATVLRHYSSSAATMRQNMRTMQAHFAERAAAFQAFNPEFDADYATHWLAAIDEADTTPTNTVRVGELKEDTAAVNDVMTQAQNAVQTVFYFVGRAFPHNAGRLDQYGRRTYVAARDNHDLMRTLLATAFASATRDKVALAAKGYTAASLAALGALAEQLKDTNTTQEVKKGENIEGTDHYLTAQNLAYGYGQEVSAAAKILFAQDAAALGLFRLTSRPAPGPEHHEVTVAAGHTGYLPFTTPLLEGTPLHLHLAAPEPGSLANVWRTPAQGGASPLKVTLTAAAPDLDLRAADLGPAGQLVAVGNNGSGPVRVEVALGA